MPLTRDHYDVWVNRDGRDIVDGMAPDYTVAVTTGDQMRGELELNKLNMPSMREAPLNGTAVFIWAAMARLGYTDKVCPEFLAVELAEFNPVKRDVPVDPTTAGPGAPA